MLGIGQRHHAAQLLLRLAIGDGDGAVVGLGDDLERAAEVMAHDPPGGIGQPLGERDELRRTLRHRSRP
jgi:hypothetical protein